MGPDKRLASVQTASRHRTVPLVIEDKRFGHFSIFVIFACALAQGAVYEKNTKVEKSPNRVSSITSGTARYPEAV